MPEYPHCHCGQPYISHGMVTTTLVGYGSPPGHDHDDNCMKATFRCGNGHEARLSYRRECPACDWKGMKTCGCHDGDKLSKADFYSVPEVLEDWVQEIVDKKNRQRRD